MRYFISDMHFFHKNILGFGQRNQFNNLEEMHTYMINKWNSVVKHNDLVYIIGDFSFGNYCDTEQIVQQLKGEKILIRGNHDSMRTDEYINMGFKDVRDELYIKINGEKILLKHYPYHKPVRYFFQKLLGRIKRHPKYEVFYPTNRGWWHIYGHHHGGKLVNGKEINVSSETLNYIPIGENKIWQLISA